MNASAPKPKRPGFPASLASVLPPSARPQPSKPLMAATLKPLAARPVNEGVVAGLAAKRQAMVRRLMADGIRDELLLATMGSVERHRFVDAALADQAYDDTSLPIGLSQTISKPTVVARMIELMRQGRTGKLGKVLEIGTGCGYQAAVLAGVAQQVISIERLRGLHDKARTHLHGLRLGHVRLVLGDGMLGLPQQAPFDGIIAAAGGEAIPPAWIDQLAVGGRLVAPVVTRPGMQTLVVVDKTAAGVHHSLLEAVNFVALKSGTS